MIMSNDYIPDVIQSCTECNCDATYLYTTMSVYKYTKWTPVLHYDLVDIYQCKSCKSIFIKYRNKIDKESI